MPANGLPTCWNEARAGRLEMLYREGLSFSLIAEDIGVSRNAAIGKAHRLNLVKRSQATTVKPQARGGGPKKQRPSQSKAAKAARLAARQRPVVRFIPGRDYRCGINDLKNCSCRYPLWAPSDAHPERRYCGFPTANLFKGVPYCRQHTELCLPARD